MNLYWIFHFNKKSLRILELLQIPLFSGCDILASVGFKPSNSNASIMLHIQDGKIVIILIYVDGILVTINNTTLMEQIILKLNYVFSLKDWEDLHYFLGIETTRTKYFLILNQNKYILQFLNRARLHESKDICNLMVVGKVYFCVKFDGDNLQNTTQYRAIGWALQYCMLMRPYISYPVEFFFQFVHFSYSYWWESVKRLLRYLKGIYELGVLLSESDQLSLYAYIDENWPSCSANRHIMGGHYIYLGGSLISSSTRKQKLVSRSFIGFEIRALALTVIEVI